MNLQIQPVTDLTTMKKSQHCHQFLETTLARIFLILGWFAVLQVPATAGDEAARKIKPDDVIAWIRSGTNSLSEFDRISVGFRAERERFGRELSAILTDPGTSDIGVYAATYYLGEIRFSDAAGVLALRIGYAFDWAKYPWSTFPDIPPYPVVEALVKIGSPSIPALFRNLEESDVAKTRELSLIAICRIDGDKELTTLRLQKAANAQRDSTKKARLETALGVLRNPASGR